MSQHKGKKVGKTIGSPVLLTCKQDWPSRCIKAEAILLFHFKCFSVWHFLCGLLQQGLNNILLSTKKNGEDLYQFIIWPSAFKNSRGRQRSFDPFFKFKHWIWPTFEGLQKLQWAFLALVIKSWRQVLPPQPLLVPQGVRRLTECVFLYVISTFTTENRNHG